MTPPIQLLIPPPAFMGFGFTEILLVGFVALLVFGGNLPDVMRQVGRAYGKFRRSLHELSQPVREELRQVRQLPGPSRAPTSYEEPEGDEGSEENGPPDSEPPENEPPENEPPNNDGSPDRLTHGIARGSEPPEIEDDDDIDEPPPV